LGNEVTDRVLFEPYLTQPLLEAQAAPRITKHPQAQSVAEGQFVAFTVVAEGSLPLDYQWYRDSQPVAGATSAVLTLPMVTLQQAGEYTVKVSNPAGEVLSLAARLTVQTPVQDKDWAAQQVVLYNSAEAELLARTGDIDNLGFGWPPGFDPFSGNSTPVHLYPWTPNPLDAPGTDRIMVVTSYVGHPPAGVDGYTQNTSRPGNRVEPLTLRYDLKGITIRAAVLQIFVDDVQPLRYGSHFTVLLDGTNAPIIADQLNQLDQHGPIGKLMNFALPSQYFGLLNDGNLDIRIDDLTSGAGDGFALDFGRLLINPLEFVHKGVVQGQVVDRKTRLPLGGAVVLVTGLAQATTEANGRYRLENVPAGLAVVQAALAGYVPASQTVDVISDQIATVDFALDEEVSAAIRITAIRLIQNQIELKWEGGRGTFAVESARSLSNPQWQSMLETVQQIALLPRTASSTFFRIRQK
jgi:hypothetical protein